MFEGNGCLCAFLKDERRFVWSEQGEEQQAQGQSQQASLLQEDRIMAAGRLPQLA